MFGHVKRVNFLPVNVDKSIVLLKVKKIPEQVGMVLKVGVTKKMVHMRSAHSFDLKFLI